MFDQVIRDSAWAHHSHRGWTTLASFTLQALSLSLLFLAPLIYPQGLPKLLLTEYLVAPAAPAGPQPAAPAAPHTNPSAASNMSGHTLLAPGVVPRQIAQIHESAGQPA